MHSLPAILLLVAGILGVAPVDGRLAWLAILLAGLFMLLPV
jgi:hypothetical protein